MSQPMMEYNFLGKCGVKVSNICLGTMTFGQHKDWAVNFRNLDEERSHKILDAYASHGGNFIDTADIYSLGKSEEVVGNWLSKHDRNKFVIATKVGAANDPNDINSAGLSRRHIVESCEKSLERLKTSYIDLYQAHIWDAATPLDETLRTFHDLIRCGKVRYYGGSNFCGWQLQKTICRLEAMGMNSCISLQQQYSLLCRQSELDEFVVCENEGVAVLPWSPLKGGLLTGKYQRGSNPDAISSRVGHGKSIKYASEACPSWDKYTDNETYWKLVDVMKGIAKKHGKSVSQVALRWLLQKDVVTSVIVGVTSVEQLEDNMAAATGWKLSQEEVTQLDEASAIVAMYPFNWIGALNSQRNNPYNEVHKYM